MCVFFRLFHFSLAVTAIVVWPTVTEIRVKKITRRLSLWVEFPQVGVGFTSQSNLCWFPPPVVTHNPQGRRSNAYAGVVPTLSCTELEASGSTDVSCFVTYARGEHQRKDH